MMLDKLIAKRINLSRQETVMLSLLMDGSEVKIEDFANAGIASTAISNLSMTINNKFKKCDMNLRIVCKVKRGKRYPHVRCLVEKE